MKIGDNYDRVKPEISSQAKKYTLPPYPSFSSSNSAAESRLNSGSSITSAYANSKYGLNNDNKSGSNYGGSQVARPTYPLHDNNSALANPKYTIKGDLRSTIPSTYTKEQQQKQASSISDNLKRETDSAYKGTRDTYTASSKDGQNQRITSENTYKYQLPSTISNRTNEETKERKYSYYGENSERSKGKSQLFNNSFNRCQKVQHKY